MLLPKSRGALSQALFAVMRDNRDTRWREVADTDPGGDDDAQIALWALYELHYRGFDDVSDSMEWHPELLRVRALLEKPFEAKLRRRFDPPHTVAPFADAFSSYVDRQDGRSLASFVQRDADREQVLDLLRQRSIYHLKESDPTGWVVPRLGVRAQTAVMELQFDEYGAGNPNRHHAAIFARGLEACGLGSEYGAYIDEVPVEVLEQNNAMSLFGLHRRLRGAALGHLAAFESTSSLPCRRMSRGLSRLRMPPEIIDYYDEHVEADAVHEQLAVRTICGSLLEEEPKLVEDIFFGAFTCLDLEDRFTAAFLASVEAA